MFKFPLILIITIISTVTQLSAQDCFEYYKTNCKSQETKYNYTLNKSSVSFKFASGESRIIPFEMYSGKDYRLLLCADGVFDNVIKIKIISEDGKVIYDNSQNNFALNMEFACKKSQSAEIELSAPEPAVGISDTIYEEGCIGIRIEEMVSMQTGF